MFLTTPSSILSYTQYIEIDGSLEHCFQSIMVNEIIDVLLAIVLGYEESHGVYYTSFHWSVR